MIDLQALPDIAKQQVGVLTDAIHPLATDPRVKAAQRTIARTVRRARRSTPQSSSRPSTWMFVAAAALVVVAVLAALRLWKRRGLSTADLGPDVDVTAAQEPQSGPHLMKKSSSQPAA